MIRPNVVLCDLPPHIRGAIIKTFDNGEDFYTVVLNSRLSREEQRETYLHETRHLDANDFDNVEVSVDTIEYLRHGVI